MLSRRVVNCVTWKLTVTAAEVAAGEGFLKEHKSRNKLIRASWRRLEEHDFLPAAAFSRAAESILRLSFSPPRHPRVSAYYNVFAYGTTRKCSTWTKNARLRSIT